VTEGHETERLNKELDRAYLQLSEITSRLLAVNEAADALAATHDRDTLAAALLEVTGQTVGARRAALFLAHGEGLFGVIATLGIGEDEEREIAASLPDIAICHLVESEQRSFRSVQAATEESFREWVESQQREDPEAIVTPIFDLFVLLEIEGRVIAVLALAARDSGVSYGDDEITLLEHIGGQGAMALDRALLLQQNQDRLSDLDALLRISKELASTLDLDRVLLTAVNTTAAIVNRERAVLALFEGQKLQIRAISDYPRVDKDAAEKLGLTRVLEWLSLRRPEILTANLTEATENEALEGRQVLEEYFRGGEMRSLLAIGLKDDQGPVGCLLLESYSEDAFGFEADRDALGVLAGQLAVSIRNAELYRQLPMVSALAPLAERRRRWQRLTPAQRQRWIAIAIAALLVFAIIPWPRAVAGDGQLTPSSEVPVRAEVSGILREVLVESGARVRTGQILARLDESSAGARLAELRADAERARALAAEAEVAADPVGQRLAQLDRDRALARLAAAGAERGRTDLIAPADGYVLTPALRSREGAWLEAGEMYCHVSPLDTLRVEVAVSETDIGSVRPGQALRLKVLGFPDRQFRGAVTEVSWLGEPDPRGRPSSFLVRGWVANHGRMLRSGMTGRARIDVGRATIAWRWTRDLYRRLRLSFWM
jgi:RND family efflux transporter MFP subunit